MHIIIFISQLVPMIYINMHNMWNVSFLIPNIFYVISYNNI